VLISTPHNDRPIIGKVYYVVCDLPTTIKNLVTQSHKLFFVFFHRMQRNEFRCYKMSRA
jgi:hypothetical protein